MRHEVIIRARHKDNLVVRCSCGKFNGETDEITLDRLATLVHEHIEAAQLDRPVNWAGSTVEAETVRVQGYRAESAITSEDQMIDIETGRQLGAIVRDRLGT